MTTTPTITVPKRAAAEVSVHRRHGDWQSRSHAHIRENRDKPFAWGTHDCCTSVCDHVQAITGVDLYAEFRHTYTDQKSAFVSIRKITGGSTVEDVAVYVAKKFGIPELKSVRFAQRGDVVLCDQPNGDGGSDPILGFVNLDGQVGLFTGENGLMRIPVAKCRRAWRIGALHPANDEVKK